MNDNQPLPFPTDRRPNDKRRNPAINGEKQQRPADHFEAILTRLAALSDAIDDLAEIVIADAARENRPRG